MRTKEDIKDMRIDEDFKREVDAWVKKLISMIEEQKKTTIRNHSRIIKAEDSINYNYQALHELKERMNILEGKVDEILGILSSEGRVKSVLQPVREMKVNKSFELDL